MNDGIASIVWKDICISSVLYMKALWTTIMYTLTYSKCAVVSFLQTVVTNEFSGVSSIDRYIVHGLAWNHVTAWHLRYVFIPVGVTIQKNDANVKSTLSHYPYWPFLTFSTVQTRWEKIVPIGDWGHLLSLTQTSLKVISSWMTRRPVTSDRVSLRSDEVDFWQTLRSRDSITRMKLKNPAREILDILV